MGYFGIDREHLQNWEWLDDKDVFYVFVRMLEKANFTPKIWKGVFVNRGQFVTSYDRLASEFGYSVQSIRTIVNKLKKTKNLTSKSTNKFTIITICDYDGWMGISDDSNEQTNKQTNEPLTNNQQTTNKQLTNNQQQLNNDNKDNKDNKDNNERNISFFNRAGQFFEISSLLADAWSEQVMITLHIEPTEYRKLAEQFVQEQRIKDNHYQDERDFRNHFFNTLKYRSNNGINNQPNQTESPRERSIRELEEAQRKARERFGISEEVWNATEVDDLF